MKKVVAILITISSIVGISLFAHANTSYQPTINQLNDRIDVLHAKKGDIFIEKLENRIEEILETPRSKRITIILEGLLKHISDIYAMQDVDLGNFEEIFKDNIDPETPEENTKKEKKVEPTPHPKHQEGGAEFNTIGYYKVTGNELTFIDGIDSKTYRSLWDTFQKIIPKDLRNSIAEFNAYNDPDGWTAASVSTTEATDSVKWGLTLNTSMTTKNGKFTDDGIEIIIHEFGHILTLADDQIKHVRSEDPADEARAKKECKTFFADSIGGCIYKKSYLDTFIQSFWSNAEYLRKTKEDEQFNAHTGHETDFVSGYAASGPVEDIAESFAHFVLKEKPLGKTIAEKKILFFYNYPDFVRLRNHVHANIKK